MPHWGPWRAVTDGPVTTVGARDFGIERAQARNVKNDQEPIHKSRLCLALPTVAAWGIWVNVLELSVLKSI